MKHIIIILCMVFAYFNQAKAQITISTPDLSGTKWQLSVDYDSQSKEYFEYTQKTKIWHKKDGSSITYPFYLSNTIPTKFENRKVGTTTKGCYYVQMYAELEVLLHIT